MSEFSVFSPEKGLRRHQERMLLCRATRDGQVRQNLGPRHVPVQVFSKKPDLNPSPHLDLPISDPTTGKRNIHQAWNEQFRYTPVIHTRLIVGKRDNPNPRRYAMICRLRRIHRKELVLLLEEQFAAAHHFVPFI